jgi:hypothetical protein
LFGLDRVPKQVVIACEIPTHRRGAKGDDHFQPQYRMAFALKSGFKKGTLSWILHQILAGNSLVNLFIRCKLRQRRDLRIQKGTEGSNHTRSATQSELQRKSASISREIRETCPYFAIFPRQTGLERTDYSAVKSVTLKAFLTSSPVSRRA